MGEIFLISLAAAANPTLVAASTVMLLLPNPKRLMLAYLAGAALTSISIGLAIVFALRADSSGAVSTTQHALSPAVDLVLGGLALAVSAVLASGRDRPYVESRREKRAGKPEPRWRRTLSRGSPRATFVIGVVLTLPGASYLAGLRRIDVGDYGTAETVLLVIAFNLVMLMLLELPLLGFVLAPEWTPRTIERAKAWGQRRGRRVAIVGTAALGCGLILKGILGLLN